LTVAGDPWLKEELKLNGREVGHLSIPRPCLRYESI
jgi:hypothetical protein